MIYLFSALSRLPPASLAHFRPLLDDSTLLERVRNGERLTGVHPSVSKALAKIDWKRCEVEDRRAEGEGTIIVTWSDSRYPEGLKNLPDAPPALFVLGRPEALRGPAVAIVGSRLSTVYGQNVARMFGQDLARAGLTVTSGLARGVDTAAHEGSLSAPGFAVAVLGTGIDQPYPKENAGLLKRIVDLGGAAVSEFPPGTPPAPRNFPQRNRVIAALSWAVLVVEATERSGALITARFALETGKDVFAVPHNITSRTGIGPNTLIQKGAKLIQQVQDVLDELPEHIRCMLKPLSPFPHGDGGLFSPLSEPARCLLSALRPDEGRGLDALCSSTRLSAAEALAAMLDLQMAGLCVELPGARYALKGPTKESR